MPASANRARSRVGARPTSIGGQRVEGSRSRSLQLARSRPRPRGGTRPRRSRPIVPVTYGRDDRRRGATSSRADGFERCSSTFTPVERGERVGERVRVVRERAGVDHDRVAAPARALDRVDEVALVVRLEVLERRARARPRPRRASPTRSSSVVGAVDLGLALAEQVQVRPREQEDRRSSPVSAPDADRGERDVERGRRADRRPSRDRRRREHEGEPAASPSCRARIEREQAASRVAVSGTAVGQAERTRRRRGAGRRCRRRSAPAHAASCAREHEPDRDRLAVEQLVAAAGLERVRERVAVVQRGAQPGALLADRPRPRRP